jgi:hypothetical protein
MNKELKNGAFPEGLNLSKQHHAVVHSGLRTLFAIASKKLERPFCFSFRMDDDGNGNCLHVFRILPKTQEMLGLPFREISNASPWAIHAIVSQYLASFI